MAAGSMTPTCERIMGEIEDGMLSAAREDKGKEKDHLPAAVVGSALGQLVKHIAGLTDRIHELEQARSTTVHEEGSRLKHAGAWYRAAYKTASHPRDGGNAWTQEAAQ
jgi:hypothetical protein